MNELLNAAKAVIDRWDAHHVVVDGTLLADLRAAVERAEKQEAVGFDAWMKAYMDDGPDFPPSAIHGWRAGQQDERERIKQIIVYEFSDLVSDLSGVMEMIDGC